MQKHLFSPPIQAEVVECIQGAEVAGQAVSWLS